MEPLTSSFERGFQIGFQIGLMIGRLREHRLIMRQLELQIGTLNKRAQASVRRLSIKQLESLGEALLNFTDARDLTRWLREHTLTGGKTTKRKAG